MVMSKDSQMREGGGEIVQRIHSTADLQVGEGGREGALERGKEALDAQTREVRRKREDARIIDPQSEEGIRKEINRARVAKAKL